MAVLQADTLTKVYGSHRQNVLTQALDGISLTVEPGEFLGIMGPSGSGKTTLLNILATIDQPSSGSFTVDGTDPRTLSGQELALFRRRKLGFIFQDFNLLDTLTIQENIVLPLVLDKVPPEEISRRLQSVTELLHITDILPKRTTEVSGGQQQRAAAARAIIHRPSLILADEPTGNLDSKAARDLMEALGELNGASGATIVVVTHDPLVASFCRRILFIRDGRLYTEIRKGTNRQAFFQQILDVLSLLGGNGHDLLADRR